MVVQYQFIFVLHFAILGLFVHTRRFLATGIPGISSAAGDSSTGYCTAVFITRTRTVVARQQDKRKGQVSRITSPSALLFLVTVVALYDSKYTTIDSSSSSHVCMKRSFLF